jgi:hypothetical protein
VEECIHFGDMSRICRCLDSEHYNQICKSNGYKLKEGEFEIENMLEKFGKCKI